MEKQYKSDLKGIKQSMTKFLTFVNEYNLETGSPRNLAVRLEKAEELWAKFGSVQSKLESLRDDGEIDEHARTLFEDIYFEAVSKAKDILDSINKANTRDKIEQVVDTNININSKMQLPTLTLPNFNGDYTKWLLFKDSYVSAIHSNHSLSNIEKFRYLRSTLQGDALQLLASLETTHQNYTVAWNMLLNRYENERIIIHTHLKAIFDIPLIHKETYTILRHTIDQFQMHLRALEALNEPVNQWDTILIHLLASKLDWKTRREWEEEIGETFATSKPTLKDLTSFLSNRCQILEMTDRVAKQDSTRTQTYRKPIACATTTQTCSVCNNAHYTFKCETFLKLTPADRAAKARELRLCINCLRPGHYVRECTSTSTCRKCNKNHNTLLHYQEKKYSTNGTPPSQKTGEPPANQASGSNPSKATITNCFSRYKEFDVLLSTAIIHIYDVHNRIHEARALLDSGSQASFISKNLMVTLGLKGNQINIPVHGISNASTNISEMADIRIKSRHNNFNTQLNCLVLNKITQVLPPVKIDRNHLRIPTNITLADPDFHIPKEIEILIGADIFWDLLCIGQIRLGSNEPILQKTLLGWVISGPITSRIQSQLGVVSHHTSNVNLKSQMETFWKLEETTTKPQWSAQEVECETQFKKTIARQENGRFVVGLPMKTDIKLGDSLQGARKRFYYLEKRLDQDPDLKRQYCEFMDQYEALGHMTEVNQCVDQEAGSEFYLPHHPVIKEESLTTKLRVVFDGSFKTSNGHSLNDKLLVGPSIQDDLINIILRFRSFQYVITADIAMMFRQILISPEDRNLQKICWRRNSSDVLKYYTLNTVTYGTSSAPFLAARVLRQLAMEDGSKYPLAKVALERDFYMDDVLTGAKSKEEAIQLQTQLMDLLKQGGFPLRKWRSNDEEILNHLDVADKAQHLLKLDKDILVKTLGLLWNAQTDTIEYTIQTKFDKRTTKRNILSRISTIFDPLGLLGPVIITAKVIMQQLWELHTDWDDQVPQQLHTEWTTYSQSLAILNQLKIQRNINPNNEFEQFDIHGFCDASLKSYGACLYAYYRTNEGNIATHLICAKSRVAPLKTITLPRLELCGALVLARLVHTAKQALKEKIRGIHLWSDSTIVLAWIKTPPSQLKTFVSNRTAEIQNLTDDAQWHHVRSEHNPADVISRGLAANQLLECELWWKGPGWMSQETWSIPRHTEEFTTTLEYKSLVSLVTVSKPFNILTKYSSIVKLQRILAYVLRFINNTRKIQEELGSLTVTELKQSLLKIIHLVQQEVFTKEISSLKQNKILQGDSRLRNLNPFIDENGMLRVGGRLKNSMLSSEHKHPYILPADHQVTYLLVQQEHQNAHHGGHELVLSLLRSKYWILSGRRIVKKIIHRCITCFRYNPRVEDHIMGNLPKERVIEVSRPFLTTGIDYAGPIQLKEGKRRGRPVVTKAYIAVFVCFSTKAVHLELITDLTTDAFLAALKRFTSRRGLCINLYSDNATNFVGANAKLREIHEFIRGHEHDLKAELNQRQITWHFIPPRAPHFGGLWESAVKSMKTHFYKVTQALLLTYEECYTLLTEIEAIMNSRPLTPLSSDPTDLNPLTPAHFLIGDSITSPVERNQLDIPTNRLSRWEHIQKIKQHFWKRWSQEYLHGLQSRSKWHNTNSSIQIGDLVLLIEDNVPPLRWRTGRVIAVHPGEDKVIRVVTVKCSSGVFKRPVKKCCVLPVNSD